MRPMSVWSQQFRARALCAEHPLALVQPIDGEDTDLKLAGNRGPRLGCAS